jgi:endonuclease IV
MLAEVIVDFQMHPTMICESPILDVDARRMKETLQVVLEKKSNQKPENED